jgi:hypothetical protein
MINFTKLIQLMQCSAIIILRYLSIAEPFSILIYDIYGVQFSKVALLIDWGRKTL